MALDYDAVFWLAMHSGEGPARASQIAHAATPGSYELAWARCYASSLGDVASPAGVETSAATLGALTNEGGE